MNEKPDFKRIAIYLAFAFGIAWVTGLAIYLTGGLFGSPVLIPVPGVPGGGFTLAALLLPTAYMMAPALAHILTRLITREGWQNVYLRPKLRQGWPYWLAAWFLPPLLTILGAVLFFVLFPRYYDSSLSLIRDQLDQTARMTGQTLPLTPWMVVAINTGTAILLAPILNAIFSLGEEFGWRAYLQPKLMPLGGRGAVLLVGLIWGIWHWPIILMGGEYGALKPDYPGAPWSGLLLFLWVTWAMASLLGWATLRGRSVWPAVIGHGATNGIASVAALFMQGDPNPLLGPLPLGLIGGAAWALLALWIFLSPKALTAPAPALQPVEVERVIPAERGE